MTGASAAGLAGHAFLRGMPDEAVAIFARGLCGVTRARAGHRFFEEGGTASRFWLLRTGHVALDVHPPGARLIIETLGQGDLLGLSWLVPPYEWQFGAVAVADTEAFELDAATVRAACEEDPVLGYQLLRRALSAASARLQATRIRLLDMYSGSSKAGSGS
jgi:CRP/FNR family transcriptional regulator, cyclic AMP receptor protein